MAELTNDEANDLADQILLREDFLPARDPGFFSRAVDDVVEFISDLLGPIFEALFGGTGGAAGTTLAVILVSIAAVILLFAIYKAITGRVPKEKDETELARVVFDEVVEPEKLRSELAQLISKQNWRGAVIAGFRLAVVGLIEDNIAREVAGATTGDFARAVELRKPELLASYRSASGAFERAFYSDLEITRADLGRVEDLLGSLAKAGAK